MNTLAHHLPDALALKSQSFQKKAPEKSGATHSMKQKQINYLDQQL